MGRYEETLKYFIEQKTENERITKDGIEKYRKGDCTLYIKQDKLDDITVEIQQRNHEFKFGCNIFMLSEFENEEKNNIYKDSFKELFNTATLPFYWNSIEPNEGEYRFAKDCIKMYRRPSIDLCMEFCKENNIEPKLHCLNYDSLTPTWTHNLSVDKMKEKLENRFKVIAEKYSSSIPMIEVTNETLMAKHNNEFFMEDDFLEWSYQKADKYFPNNNLIINDYNIWDPTSNNRNYYYMQIERLLRNGITHLDTIGMQFHSFFPKENESKYAYQRYNPYRLRELFDLFAKFNRELQITEMTIPAYSNSEYDEEVQKELTVGLYKVFFSHPNMNGIIYWNLVDGYAYLPNGGEPGDMTKGENVYYGSFMRFDMTKKPVYYAIKDLINKEWHTSIITKPIDEKISFKGFYGNYEITIHKDGKVIKKEISILKNKNNTYNIDL